MFLHFLNKKPKRTAVETCNSCQVMICCAMKCMGTCSKGLKQESSANLKRKRRAMNIAIILPIDLRKHRWRFIESVFLRATTRRQRQYILSHLLRRLFNNNRHYVSLLCSQGSFNSYIICIHIREESLAFLVFFLF